MKQNISDGDIFNEEDDGYLTGGTVQPICLPGHFHHVSDVDCEVSRNYLHIFSFKILIC